MIRRSALAILVVAFGLGVTPWNVGRTWADPADEWWDEAWPYRAEVSVSGSE